MARKTFASILRMHTWLAACPKAEKNSAILAWGLRRNWHVGSTHFKLFWIIKVEGDADSHWSENLRVGSFEDRYVLYIPVYPYISLSLGSGLIRLCIRPGTLLWGQQDFQGMCRCFCVHNRYQLKPRNHHASCVVWLYVTDCYRWYCI